MPLKQKIKNLIKKLSGLILILRLCTVNCYATELIDISKETMLQKLMNLLNLNDLTNWFATNEITVNINRLFSQLISGNIKLNSVSILDYLKPLLLKQVKATFAISTVIILIILLHNILINLCDGNNSSINLVNYTCLATITTLIIGNIVNTFSSTIVAFNSIKNYLNITLPVMAVLMTTLGYSSTISVLSIAILSETTIAINLFCNYLLPILLTALGVAILLSLTNVRVTKLFSLTHSMIRKICFILLCINSLILTIYKTLVPFVDYTVNKTAKKLLINLIPVGGNLLDTTISTFMNLTTLVKNAYTWLILLGIALVTIPKLINLIVNSLNYKLLSATSEIMNDSILSNILGYVSTTYKTILITVSCVVALVITSIMLFFAINGCLIS